MLNRILVIVLFLLAITAASSLTLLYVKSKGGASSTSVAGGTDEKKVQEIVKDFLTKNPQVIVESFVKAREAEQLNEQQKAESAIEENRAEIESSDKSPTAGNPNGDVVLVAFHDYNCGFCKRSVPDVVEILNTDKNVKFVIKEFPILGDLSVEKAKASEAVNKVAPEKWFSFYQELSKKSPQSIEGVLEVAASLGVNPELIRSEMKSEDIQNKVNDNLALGQKVGVRGTPAFIIGGKFVNGAIGLDNMKELVEAARANGSGKSGS
jgi:protein-disulfide isomerase